MLTKTNKKLIIIPTIIFAVLLLGSCDPLVRVTDGPILLMRLSTPSSSMVSFSNFRIVETDDSETVMYYGELTLQEDENDGGTPTYSASYTYFLEQGKSYKTIKFLADGEESTDTITIASAEEGMVYYINIGRE